MDIASLRLHKNIPQEEGIDIACAAYDKFHKNNPPISTKYLQEMLRLILKETSFHFNDRLYLQTYGTAMGTKKAVSCANIFMAQIETEILSRLGSINNYFMCQRAYVKILSMWEVWRARKRRRSCTG